MKTSSIILAAGRGSRLRKLTANLPKCLVKINGKTLISRNLKILKKNKIDKIYVVGGYNSKKLLSKEYQLIINNEYKQSNMLWSLFKAKSKLNGNVIISYGDIIFSSKLLKRMINSKNDIVVAIDKQFKSYWKKRFKNPYRDLESLSIRHNQIVSIGERVSKKSKIDGQYIGLIKLNNRGCKIFKTIFNKILEKQNKHSINKIRKMYLTSFLQTIINFGYVIRPILFSDNWVEIDTVKDAKSNYTFQRLKKII